MPTSNLVAPEVPARNASVRYDESTKGSLWFIAKGVILTVLTVGIYRFWFTTAIRRNLWARAFIDGSPAEYTGKAHELLLGFLVALAILLPAYIAVFAATMYLPNPTLGFFVAYILLFLLVQFARYRARRYIASRTLWRGIRFRQDGSALTYTALAAGWWLVTLLTLGVGYPFMRASLERYRIRHTLFGEARFASDASGLSVLFHWMIVYALSILPIIGCIIVLLAADDFRMPIQIISNGSITTKFINVFFYYKNLLPQDGIENIVFVTILSLINRLILWPYYRSRETRAFFSNLNLGDANVYSKLSADKVYNQYFKFFRAITGGAMVVMITMGSASYVFKKNLGSVNEDIIIFDILISISIFLQFISFSYSYFLHLQVGRLAIIAETLSIIGADALAAVTTSTRMVDGRLAEGVADAVDPGGIEIGF